MAHVAREGLFVNPFITIKVERTERPGDGLIPVLSVKLTNISPQAITLNADQPEDLLVVRVTTQDGKEMPVKNGNAAPSGTLSFKPGEQVDLKDVKWWKRLEDGAVLEPHNSYWVSFEARSPGLWEVTAKGGGLWGIEGEEILKEMRSAKR
jgi:hypothetical protein